MTRLVRLYPGSWRVRYEAELVDLLSRRPLSLSDRIDLVRGAIDAHLHPQADVPPMPWTHRLPGLAVLATGLLWSAAYLMLLLGDFGSDRLIGVAAVTVLLGLPGDYMMAYGRRIAAVLGALAVAAVLIVVSPWPLAVVIYVAAFVLFLSGALTLAAIRAGIGPTKRWLLLGGTVVVPIILGVVVSLTGLTDGEGGRSAVLLAVPYGAAWALIGIRMVVRGSPTIIDPTVLGQFDPPIAPPSQLSTEAEILA